MVGTSRYKVSSSAEHCDGTAATARIRDAGQRSASFSIARSVAPLGVVETCFAIKSPISASHSQSCEAQRLPTSLTTCNAYSVD
eukprot:5441606-Pleurochrysis_carterae.AAC.3